MNKFDQERLHNLRIDLSKDIQQELLHDYINIFANLNETYLHITYKDKTVCKITANGSGYNVTFTNEFDYKGLGFVRWLPGCKTIMRTIKKAISDYEERQKVINDTSINVSVDVNAVEKEIYRMTARYNGKPKFVKNNIRTNIKDVIFNDPATIVFWTDGSKTVVKCQPGEKFDPEKGLAMAISKKVLGNDYGYYETFAKYVGRYNKKHKEK
jgi:hypothetical protein